MNAAGEWAAIDPAKAIAWAEKLPDRAEQELAYANIAESWADEHPQAAAEFALQLPPAFRERAALAAVSRWATQNPAQAGDWASNCGEPTLQLRGPAQVLSVWAPAEPEAAGQWVSQLADGPARDAPIRAYVEAVNPWNPEAGLRLALRLSSPADRDEIAKQAFAYWRELDADAARQWLDASGSSAETKREWLAFPAPR